MPTTGFLPGSAVNGTFNSPMPKEIAAVLDRYRSALLRELLTLSAIALVLLVVLALLLGWWTAGHVLRPVHAITTTARRLSWQNLHERIALAGPADEFTELADTFDSMLERLDNAFASQRRFIANASHELRTPLTVQRAAIQIGLTNNPSREKLAVLRGQLLDSNRRAERLIDGLLLLARSDQGLLHCERVALDEIAAEAVAEHEPTARAACVAVDLDLEPTSVYGDPVLLAQLVTNLVQNAIRHNRPGGKVQVHTSPIQGLTVRNTGPHVAAELLPELFEPFRRGLAARTSPVQGVGLGLSIVRSITDAHSGSITMDPNAGGGLKVRVSLPQWAAEAHDGTAARPHPG
jgi:signal transduction histidine kinase